MMQERNCNTLFPDAWPVFSHKDDWILILVGRLENVPSHLRELQHAFLQQRLLSISIKLLWCCSRLKAGCDDKFPLSRLSLSFVKNQVPYSPKPWRILCFFAKPSSYFKAKVQQITYQQSIRGDSPFFPFTYTCGTNPWTVLKQFLNRQAVFLGCSKFLCHGKTWHISGPPEHLTPTVDDGWIPEMIRCTTNLFCGTVLALGNDQQRRPWAKNRTESWGRFHFHESSLWDIFFGCGIVVLLVVYWCCHLRMAGRVTEVGSTGMLYADRSWCRPWSQKGCWIDCTVPVKWKKSWLDLPLSKTKPSIVTRFYRWWWLLASV